jgi:hypothetical protein
VKKITLTVLLLFSTFAWAGANPDPSEYNVNVHVAASQMVIEGTAIAHSQKLNVVIDGKKYELKSDSRPNALLALGDYKAKIVRDDHRMAYDSYKVYEFLLSDLKTRKFIVVGQTESNSFPAKLWL